MPAHDRHYYLTRRNGAETEVIRTPSPPGRWNTDAVAVASCLDHRVAHRIAELLARHGLTETP